MKRLLRHSGLPVLLLLFSSFLFAQKVITGKVSDKNGAPLSGVSVAAKGSTRGTTSDGNGNFSLSVASSVTRIVISSVGYATQEIDVSSTTSVTVMLEEVVANINEVVVVGYGTAKRKDLTGSVATIQAKDFNRGVVTAPDQLIQGKVPGVQILSNNGAPGAGSTIRIRGTNSIRSGNEPLFVIDGFPLDYISVEGGFSSAIGNTPGVNPLNYINSFDIASIDILKDASAAAIYGSRGANGVIMINTKKTTTGAPLIEVSSYIGTASVLKKFKILSGDEYRAAISKYGLQSGNFGQSVDALGAILHNGLLQNYNVGMSGGNENAKFRFSTGYQNEEGIVKQTGFKKFTTNLTSNLKFLDSRKFGLDVRLMASHTIDQLGPVTNDAGFQQSVVGTALQWNPTHALTVNKPDSTDNQGRVIYRNGIWVQDPNLGNTTINPLAMLASWDVKGNTSYLLGNLQPYYKFNDHWEYRFLYGIIHQEATTKAQVARWLNQQNIETRGVAGIFINQLTSQQLTHTLTYNGKINPELDLNALIGYEYRKQDYSGSGMSGQDFSDNGIPYYNQLQGTSQNSRSIYSYASPIEYLQSFFARANFNYRQKYYLTATFRADGSSKFGKNNKYGYFPSFGAAWTMSSEEFIKNISFINYMKLRVGWGRCGNQEYPGGAALASASVQQGGGTSFNNFGNESLKWETVTNSNVALDFTVWQNRITGSVEYFNKITSDPLFLTTTPQPGPLNSKYWTNLHAKVHNSGVEIALLINVVKQKDFTCDVGANMAFLQNKLTDLIGVYETGALHGQGISGATSQRMVSNYPLNEYYLRVWQGIDKTTGQSLYQDDGYTKYYVGDPNPKTLLGITTTVEYKKWQLRANLRGAFGHYLYNNTANSVLPVGNLGTRNISSEILKLSNQEDVSDPIAPSTRYLEKGNFVKLGDATISYRFGTIQKTVKNLVVYLTAQNLFVITKFTGFDPEVNVDKSVDGLPSYGIEYTPYPTARKFIFGINFSL
jgi:iron complex outermembrane receptor protein